MFPVGGAPPERAFVCRLERVFDHRRPIVRRASVRFGDTVIRDGRENPVGEILPKFDSGKRLVGGRFDEHSVVREFCDNCFGIPSIDCVGDAFDAGVKPSGCHER